MAVKRPELTAMSLGRTSVIALAVAVLTTAVNAQETDVQGAYVARGLLTAPARIELASPLQAQIVQLPFNAGDRFERDALLVGFDCDRYAAEENAAKAGADAAWIDYNSKKRLLKHGAVGKDEVRLAGARAKQATAEASIREVFNKGCRIVAPFSGRVAEVNAHPHEYPKPGEPLLVIIDDRHLEVELVVPSNWLSWLRTGSAFTFEIEETGDIVSGSVARLSPEIDPVSQTIRVFGQLQSGSGATLLSGMSGVARFDRAADG